MKTKELQEFLKTSFGHLLPPQIMALTIYGEARGEPREGKIAVGSVILQRVEHRSWDGETIEEVCLCPKQFSCFLPSDKNLPALKLIASDWDNKFNQSAPLRECHTIALGLISGNIPQNEIIAQKHCCQYLTKAYRRLIDKQAEELKSADKVKELKNLDAKRWWIRMRLILTVAAHEFYADQ